MKKYGIFEGKKKESSKCVKVVDALSKTEIEDAKENARLNGTNVYFYICSEKQEIGSAYLK